MATIDFLLPTPLRGSGGHRTIVANAEALADRGHRVRLHVQRSRRMRNTLRKTQEWHGVQSCELSDGWPSALPDSDAVMATTWFSAGSVATLSTEARRLYFVQDYEPLFFPAGDFAVAASASYTLGLQTLVIGRWLQHKLFVDHGVKAWSVPFTADQSIYTPAQMQRAARVVAIYQPEKDRRCPALVEDTLRRLIEVTGVEVVTVGSAAGPSLGPHHRHRGIVSKEELATLYQSSRVGLCLSASNPSRVPFEMMACGLPVIELGLPNNAYDLPPEGCLLARPDPDSLAEALRVVLDDESSRNRLSNGGADYMRFWQQSREIEAFIEFVEGQMHDSLPAPQKPTPLHKGQPFEASTLERWMPSHARSRPSRALGRRFT